MFFMQRCYFKLEPMKIILSIWNAAGIKKYNKY